MINMPPKNNLLIDLGNSGVKWALVELGSAQKMSPMSHKYYPEKMSANFFVQCWQSIEAPKNIIASCVADDRVWKFLQDTCKQLWSLSAEKISSENERFGVVNAYKQPSDLGSDRWCGMIAARQETKSNFMVVSCGSAITIDVVASSGQHLGGYILPGLMMMKKSLASNTANVSVMSTEVCNTTPTFLPANTTVDCVEIGIHLAAVKLIESVYGQQKKKGSIECFLTGGDAEVISELLSLKHITLPDLVVRGLAVFANSHH